MPIYSEPTLIEIELEFSTAIYFQALFARKLQNIDLNDYQQLCH